jgi:hypothetical protein
MNKPLDSITQEPRSEEKISKVYQEEFDKQALSIQKIFGSIQSIRKDISEIRNEQREQHKITEDLVETTKTVVTEIRNFTTTLNTGFALGMNTLKLFKFIAILFVVSIIVFAGILLLREVGEQDLNIKSKYIDISRNHREGVKDNDSSEQRPTRDVLP